jgi:hypothetical protein
VGVLVGDDVSGGFGVVVCGGGFAGVVCGGGGKGAGVVSLVGGIVGPGSDDTEDGGGSTDAWVSSCELPWRI